MTCCVQQVAFIAMGRQNGLGGQWMTKCWCGEVGELSRKHARLEGDGKVMVLRKLPAMRGGE